MPYNAVTLLSISGVVASPIYSAAFYFEGGLMPLTLSYTKGGETSATISFEMLQVGLTESSGSEVWLPIAAAGTTATPFGGALTANKTLAEMVLPSAGQPRVPAGVYRAKCVLAGSPDGTAVLTLELAAR